MVDRLYRLLRDDETPMRDGIMAKCPSRNEKPGYHIDKCADGNMPCQWISTCASEKGLHEMIDIMRKWCIKNKLQETSIRWVVIDRNKLDIYQSNHESSSSKNYDYYQSHEGPVLRNVPYRERTGEILEFVEYKKYIESQKYKQNASKCEEVLVERFIPPHCCIEVKPFPDDLKAEPCTYDDLDDYLYRLLRDDEHPQRDGIMAKYPSRSKEPIYRIGQCSGKFKACQWISASASLQGLQKMIDTKKGSDEEIRWVKIDRLKLEKYAYQGKISVQRDDDLVEVVAGSSWRILPDREMTGRILDFTDQDVMDHYLPKTSKEDKKNNRPRNYASAWKEVLIERFIPPHCCFRIGYGDPDDERLADDTEVMKKIVLKSEFKRMIETSRISNIEYTLPIQFVHAPSAPMNPADVLFPPFPPVPFYP